MKQPSLDIQKEYLNLSNKKKSILELGGGKKPLKIGWILPYTMERLDHYTLEIELKEPKTDVEKHLYVKDKLKLSAKAASCIILNGFFKINLFHWFFWRWLYYVVQYNDFQYTMIIFEGQKKSPVDASLMGFQLLKTGKSTLMTMTEEEIAQFQAGQVSG